MQCLEKSSTANSTDRTLCSVSFFAGQQDLGAFHARLVEDEIGLGIALLVIAPVAEELLVQAFLRRGFQKPRRNDLIGVDIVIGQRNQAALEIGELFHGSSQSIVRTSVTTPATAVAAAVSGLTRNVRPPLPCRPSKLRLLVETPYSPGCS